MGSQFFRPKLESQAAGHDLTARTGEQPMTEDERRQARLDDEAEPGRLRPDDLFITKYLMKSLSPDERARFEARLEDDDHF